MLDIVELHICDQSAEVSNTLAAISSFTERKLLLLTINPAYMEWV
jgi:hypothetical protein